MEVRIYSPAYQENPFYEGAYLGLPTTRTKIQDAFDIARIHKGEDFEVSVIKVDYPFLKKYTDFKNADLDDLNFLANELYRRSDEKWGRYESVLAVYASEQKTNVLGCKDLINAFFNMDRFDFYPGMHEAKDLGRRILKGDTKALLGPISDEVYKLLDPEKVGQYAMEQEGGVFTSGGYGVRNKEGWVELSDKKDMAREEQADSVMLSLYLKKDQCMEKGPQIWLDLPCEEAEIEETLRMFKAEYTNNLRILDVQSAVPRLKYMIDSRANIEKLNEFAKSLKNLSSEQLVKYKAVLKFIDCEHLQEAIDLVDHLDDYTFCPECVSYGDYGRRHLERQGIDCSEKAFSQFDFDTYGRQRCEEEGIVLTLYGSVSLAVQQEEIETEDMEAEQGEEEAESMTMGMGSL